MFKSARIKLTAWYLLIIMLISFVFSMAIYRVLASELDRVERMQSVRFRLFPNPYALDRDLVTETKYRLKLFLAGINLVILGTSAVAGYFLAGRTLRPIEEMVDEQKRFVADASHELRTPLTAMKTETEVAIRDKKLTLKEAKELLASNLEEVSKIQSLSNYLLNLSRYQDKDNNFDFETINVFDVISEAKAKVKNQADKNEISFSREGEKIEIEANPDGLRELLIILLDNAIKYSHKGGKVIIKSRKNRDQAVIEVQDFGIGIKQEELPFIFNRFFRADSSRSKIKTDGYGLGLSIAKSIIELHKGEILVESVFGKGSSFIVKLPLKQPV